jgi:cell division GTPase FtsZ
MKLVIVGLGQCGGRLADEFVRLNNKARSQRGIEIVTGAFAVNTDAVDLSGLRFISGDYQHRILVGGRRTGGHGVGKLNELGAEIGKEDADKVVDGIRTVRHIYETDAFLLIAGVAGGTGSGAIPIVAKILRERYVGKPAYAMAVLPFAHEEETEERTIYNTATCLKSVYQTADATFLIDNQQYVRKDFSLKNNLTTINSLIVEPFYNLLCTGEEKKPKYIGAKIIDAGDIIQSLAGWTVIGRGSTRLSGPSASSNFIEKSTETHRGIQAMDEALSELSLKCDPANAGRGVYLISGPANLMNMDLIKDLGNYLRTISPEAMIRNGDYPRDGGMMDVTLLLSEFNALDKVNSYYTRASGVIHLIKGRRGEFQSKLKEIEEASKDLPSLL